MVLIMVAVEGLACGNVGYGTVVRSGGQRSAVGTMSMLAVT